jgi:pimeloyl-ACP methyl ester carboxylesterase
MVLVHGTTQSPSGWDRLVHELGRLGHRCATVDLAAIDGDRKSAGFAEDVAGQVDVRSPMVVAHSGSGLLLGAICDALDASRQVFLAALIPDSIHSLMDEVPQRSGEMFHTDWLGVDPVADHDAARRFLFHDCDEPTTAWALTTLRLFYPAAVYDEVVPLDTTRPATVVVPNDDRTLRSDWMRDAAADRLGVIATAIEGGHCPHVSRPAQLAELLDEIAEL